MRGAMFVGCLIGGYAAWFAGEAAGLGILGCFAVSTVGSIAGMVVAWKLARHFG